MFEMQELPFGFPDLEPYMSNQTLDFHYGKHYKGYIDKLNSLIADTPYADMSLEAIVRESYKHPEDKAIYNNAGQVWNHQFFWESMSLAGTDKPSSEVLKQIEETYGTYDDFKTEFQNKAVGIFGSGWCWVVQKDNRIDIKTTSNADNPISLNLGRPLICVDVWEHAYYLDYQNRRAEFVDTFINNLVKW